MLPHLPGMVITKAYWSNKSLRTPIPGRLIRDHVENNRLRTIDRRAKYLLFRLQTGAVLVIHLGMTGRLGLFPGNSPATKHDHLCLHFENGMELRFNDSRRFGNIIVWPSTQAPQLEKTFSSQKGLEPLDNDFSADKLLSRSSNIHSAIKTFLMNEKYVVGVGNIYANETLFCAELHPATPANHLNSEQWQRVASCCREVLTKAIAAGGTTISDFISSSGQPGYFQLQLSVYDLAGLPCNRCGTTISKTTLSGRATYFCERCQPAPSTT